MSSKYILLHLWALILIIALVLTNTNTKVGPSKYYQEKKEASLLTQEAFESIKNYKASLGIENVTEDTFNTGLIGERYTPITTTLGVLESKRTSVDPNFAAVIIDMFEEINLKKGDEVVVSFSGSFPALNIAVLAALEVFELKPLIMASIGSSSYGANILNFTFMHMANYLYEQQLFSNTIDYVSFGGSSDTGEEFDEDVKSELLNYIESTHMQLINIKDFKDNINYRLKLIKENTPNRKLLINVGGSLIALGQNESSFYQKNGLIKPRVTHSFFENNHDKGLIERTLNQNLPVIQLLNIKSLAYKYKIPYDPKAYLEIGTGDVYFEKHSSMTIPIISIGLTIIAAAFYAYYYKKEM